MDVYLNEEGGPCGSLEMCEIRELILMQVCDVCKNGKNEGQKLLVIRFCYDKRNRRSDMNLSVERQKNLV